MKRILVALYRPKLENSRPQLRIRSRLKYEGDVRGPIPRVAARAMTCLIVALLTLANGSVDRVLAQSPVEKIAYDDYFGSVRVANADGTASVVGPNGSEPSWSPDGSRIAFVSFDTPGSSTEVSVWNLRDGTVTNLTNHPANDVSPAWSPDGLQIALSSNRDGRFELYVMLVDGSGVTQLTQNVGFAAAPAWSPDGSRIAYDCQIEPGNRDICTIEVDTGFIARLTTDPAWDSGAAWSPDGARIAFGTTRFIENWSEIAVMNSDGTGIGQVTGLAQVTGIVQVDGTTTGAHLPAWSPGGSRIAFVATTEQTSYCDYDVCLQNVIYIVGDTEFTGLGVGFNPAWTSSTLTLAPPLAAFQYACSAHTCTFDASSSGDPDGTITAYEWNFGDGTFGSGATSSHTYAAASSNHVTLTVTDNSGLRDTKSVTVTVNIPPVAVFASACSALTCTFDGSGSSDPDGTIVRYAWNFGDGATAFGVVVSHTYTAAGSYPVKLTVTDNSGATVAQTGTATANLIFMYVGDLDGASTSQGGTWTGAVTITLREGNQVPVANATVIGAWSTGDFGSCTTNALGQCAVSRSDIPRRTRSVSFDVINVTHATRSYSATMNQDPDGDSTGTSITVSRP